jgi:hypothetical protein
MMDARWALQMADLFCWRDRRSDLEIFAPAWSRRDHRLIAVGFQPTVARRHVCVA